MLHCNIKFNPNAILSASEVSKTQSKQHFAFAQYDKTRTHRKRGVAVAKNLKRLSYWALAKYPQHLRCTLILWILRYAQYDNTLSLRASETSVAIHEFKRKFNPMDCHEFALRQTLAMTNASLQTLHAMTNSCNASLFAVIILKASKDSPSGQTASTRTCRACGVIIISIQHIISPQRKPKIVFEIVICHHIKIHYGWTRT